jgi:hypothetical protein
MTAERSILDGEKNCRFSSGYGLDLLGTLR